MKNTYLFLILFGLMTTVFAADIQIPDSLLTEQQKAFLEAQKTKQKVETVVQTAKEITSSSLTWGREVGEAMKGTLEAIGDFANTAPGQILLALVAFKVVGETAIGLFFGIPILILGTILWVWIYRRNCMARRILVSKNGKEKTWGVIIPGAYVPQVWNEVWSDKLTESLGVSRFLHTAPYLLFVLVMLIIIF